MISMLHDLIAASLAAAGVLTLTWLAATRLIHNRRARVSAETADYDEPAGTWISDDPVLSEITGQLSRQSLMESQTEWAERVLGDFRVWLADLGDEMAEFRHEVIRQPPADWRDDLVRQETERLLSENWFYIPAQNG
jgi:uncharacterized Zn finger protein